METVINTGCVQRVHFETREGGKKNDRHEIGNGKIREAKVIYQLCSIARSLDRLHFFPSQE